MHVHVHVCEDTPMPPDTPTHLPAPQSHREPKSPKFNKSWTNQDNLILFQDSLHLMCRWRCPIPNGTFMFLYPKMYIFSLLWPSNKNFPVFALDSIRSSLDWALIGFLTSKSINDPFNFDLKWRPKCKIRLKCQFAIELSNTKNLKCTLRCSNVYSTNHQWHWTPIIDHSWCERTLYPPPIQCKKLLNQP